jgi:hypothetical protein
MIEDFKFEMEERHVHPEGYDCKGLFFRGYRNIYASGAEVHMKQGFRLLKRKSCTGCPKCGFFHDDMGEMVDSTSLIYPDFIKNGALYSLRVTNIGTDWESGIVDSWDYEFYEVKE